MILSALLVTLAAPARPQAEAGAEATLLVQGAGEDRGLGASIALLGDVDRDGVEDLALGRTEQGNLESGGATVVLVSGASGATLWSRRSPSWWNAGFGSTLAALGDVDGDCLSDLLVGCPSHLGDPSSLESFAWVVSGRTGGGRRELRGNQVSPRAGEGNDQFATSACGGGDLDGDGVADVWVGSRLGRDPRGELVALGRVQAFSGATGAELRRFDAPQDRVAGSLLAALEDLDGDGLGEVCTAGSGRGSWLHVLSGRTAEVLMAAPLSLSQVVSLVTVPDVDGDGREDLAVGALGAAGRGARGVVMVGSVTGVELARLEWPGHPRAGFGYALAALPDLDGDGLSELAVGAPYFGELNGRVEVRSPGSGRLLAAHDGRRPGGCFGASLAAADLDGDGAWELIVGEPGSDAAGGAAAGAVHVVRWHPPSGR